jgi:hypothetical protein
VPPGPLGAIERRGGTSTQTAASEPPSAPTTGN